MTARQRVITTGRAYVRLVEAAGLLLDRNPAWNEKLLLRMMRSLCRHRLRGLVAELPSDMTAEILAASERMTGPVGEFAQN